MRFIAIAHRRPEFSPDDFVPHLKAESERALHMLADGKVRDIYSRADGKGAVLMLEAADEAEARSLMDSLPLVQKGMLEVDIYGIAPYRAFIAGLQ